MQTIIDSKPRRKGQSIDARRAIETGPDGAKIRLVINVDSSYPGQSRIHSDVWTSGGWKTVWTYHPDDFAAVPNAHASESWKNGTAANLIEDMYFQMTTDAMLVLYD